MSCIAMRNGCCESRAHIYKRQKIFLIHDPDHRGVLVKPFMMMVSAGG